MFDTLIPMVQTRAPAVQPRPAGAEPLPPGVESLPPGVVSLPPGLESLPPGVVSLPPGLESLPPGVGTLPPGPQLASVLADVDIREVSGHDRVVVLAAWERMRAWATAQSYDAMAAIAEALHDDSGCHDPSQEAQGWDEEAAAAEIRVALRLTRRTADYHLAFAHRLCGRPAVLASLRQGSIDVARARVLLDETGHLPERAAMAVIDEVVGDAGTKTTTQLRRRLRKLCLTADPDDARARYDHSVADRRVVTEREAAGTANLLGLDLPPDRVQQALAHVNQLARSLRRDGETRTMDQLRADVLLDLLAGHGAPDAGRGTVTLHADLATLAGLAELPGDLGGYGPIVADLARQVAGRHPDVPWRYAVTDPDTGRLIATGTTRRRPRAPQRRFVELRDPTCIFPGCVTPSTGCDLDHRIPWADGGPTDADNLAPLDRPDHVLRHRAGWTWQPHGDTDYLWTSRLGHRYTTSGQPP